MLGRRSASQFLWLMHYSVCTLATGYEIIHRYALQKRWETKVLNNTGCRHCNLEQSPSKFLKSQCRLAGD